MTQTAPTAYPLAWPDGWPRTPDAKRSQGAQFKSGSTYEGFGDSKRYVGKRAVTFHKAAQQLFAEMERMRAAGVVISTNARVRGDGGVYANEADRRYDDPGVAVYFTIKGKQMVMAQDAYDNLAANLRSLGLAVEAMRQLERHGGGHMMERAFAGFSALPPPEGAKPSRPWWETFGYPADPSALIAIADVEARFRRLARERHPDNAGGSTDAMAELNLAMEAARQVFR